MIQSYNRTLFHPVLTEAKVKIICTEYPKWENEGGEFETEYTGLTQWDIISGDDAKEIEKDSDLIDELNEYLVLHFENGETATFRNSHTIMFIW